MKPEDQAILDQLNTLLTTTATPPMPSIPSLDWVAPTGIDIQSEWMKFLDRASKDPDIVNYYKKVLDQAVGDTKLAISFLEKDYQVGVRQTKDNLSATLEKLGLTSSGESQTLQDTLNKRGIALTQGEGGTTPYAGGGQPATEVANLGEAQKLRKEAEVRSAQQGVETAGLTREKGITSKGMEITQSAQNLQKQKEQDILNRGQSYLNVSAGQKAADLQQKIYEQGNKSSGGSSSGGNPALVDSSGGDTELGQLYKIGGQRNPIQQSRFKELGGV